jgi:hypothetical protein
VPGEDVAGAAERVGLGDGETLAGAERGGVVGTRVGRAGAVVAGLGDGRTGPGSAAGFGRAYR